MAPLGDLGFLKTDILPSLFSLLLNLLSRGLARATMRMDLLFEEILGIFGDAVDALIDREFLKADKVVDLVRESKLEKGTNGEREKKLLKDLGISERIRAYQMAIQTQSVRCREITASLSIILDCVRRMAEYSDGIAEIALNIKMWEDLVSETRREDARGILQANRRRKSQRLHEMHATPHRIRRIT